MYQLLLGNCLDVLKTLPEKSVQCCVTSPPYFGQRNGFGVGQERTIAEYVCNLVCVFREVKRVLADDGTLWLNIGDVASGSGRGNNPKGKQGTNKGTLFVNPNPGYVPTGLKPKDIMGLPWEVAFALRDDAWFLRQDIIWHKSNPMTESVKDRPTRAHEYIFLLSKKKKYYYDYKAVRELAAYDGRKDTVMKGGEKYKESQVPDGNPQTLYSKGTERWQRGENGEYLRNRHSVWKIPTKPFKGAHHSTYPEKLIEPCILAGCPVGGTVLDPFSGAGTTILVANRLGRKAIGIELNPAYIELTEKRFAEECPQITKPN